MNNRKISEQNRDKFIAQNKKAFHDYFIEDTLEAGVVLQGWEVKSLRSGRAQLVDSHVIIKNGELFLLGMHISPLNTVSTHITPEPIRTRKLLLHREEINKFIGKVDRKGYTLVPLKVYFHKGKIKVEIGLAKGKKQFDKRAVEKERDWKREQARFLKSSR